MWKTMFLSFFLRVSLCCLHSSVKSGFLYSSLHLVEDDHLQFWMAVRHIQPLSLNSNSKLLSVSDWIGSDQLSASGAVYCDWKRLYCSSNLVVGQPFSGRQYLPQSCLCPFLGRRSIAFTQITEDVLVTLQAQMKIKNNCCKRYNRIPTTYNQYPSYQLSCLSLSQCHVLFCPWLPVIEYPLLISPLTQILPIIEFSS